MIKKRILLLSIAMAVILYIASTYIQRKLIHFNPQVEVLYCIAGVGQGKELNKANFIPTEIDITKYSPDLVRSYDEIKNKVAIENIYPNEPLNRKRIMDKNDNVKLLLEPNQRKFSIPMQFFDDPFVATLRSGDVVDILHTDLPTPQNPYPVTKSILQQAKVIGALDATGKLIDSTNKSVLATDILFQGTPQDGGEIINGKYSGKYNIFQDPINANKFDPFVIGGNASKQGN